MSSHSPSVETLPAAEQDADELDAVWATLQEATADGQPAGAAHVAALMGAMTDPVAADLQRLAASGRARRNADDTYLPR